MSLSLGHSLSVLLDANLCFDLYLTLSYLLEHANFIWSDSVQSLRSASGTVLIIVWFSLSGNLSLSLSLSLSGSMANLLSKWISLMDVFSLLGTLLLLMRPPPSSLSSSHPPILKVWRVTLSIYSKSTAGEGEKSIWVMYIGTVWSCLTFLAPFPPPLGYMSGRALSSKPISKWRGLEIAITKDLCLLYWPLVNGHFH